MFWDGVKICQTCINECPFIIASSHISRARDSQWISLTSVKKKPPYISGWFMFLFCWFREMTSALNRVDREDDGTFMSSLQVNQWNLLHWFSMFHTSEIFKHSHWHINDVIIPLKGLLVESWFYKRFYYTGYSVLAFSVYMI